jgi:cyclophilin family peptidyl-prolyl cis-trans isomerase
MITTLLAAAALAPQVYAPKGPAIKVAVAGRGTFEITTDPARSPKTVAHIVALVKKGFFDRQRVHRVEDWVTQWGAPASRNNALGSEEVTGGGSGKDIPVFERSDVDFFRGVVGIASTGFEMPGDSQIFILKKDWERLYGSYAVLGKVTKGMDVVDKIRRGDRITSMKMK